MVLQEWIVPEPDPRLSLMVTDIDIYKLNYHDIRYIYSSTMKKYILEFQNLPNFINHTNTIINAYEKQKQNYISPPPIKRIKNNEISHTPLRPVTPPLTTHKLLPVLAGTKNYNKTLSQYEIYLQGIRNNDTKSDTCIIN